jgi:pyruvate carboxylase
LARIERLLVANRSEIAIRVFRAASELGVRTIAVYAEQDKLSLHRFKADEAYRIGEGLGPIEAYLSIDEIIRVAKAAGADAVHPGYGFLSESPEFAEACAREGLVFIGPEPETLRALGDKVSARALAVSAGVPVVPASPALPDDGAEILRLAAGIGYPVMVKASWGGGGRGMRPVAAEGELLAAVASARREAMAAFGKDEVYVEKLVQRARHVEVQLLGDRHGGLVHLFERDCSIQRRHQKVIERAPAPYLDAALRSEICEAALRIGRAAGYVGAGTVEFLLDADSRAFYFIEVNPRIQVEHTVTELVTGLDIVKAQVRIAEGSRLGEPETGIPPQEEIRLSGHALQCRITTEDPENGFVPDHGRISAYRGAFGFGIRVDGGTAYAGAVVTRFYDPLLEKVTAWAPTAEETVARMVRALREYRIRGVSTNLPFLEAVLTHERFRRQAYTTRFVDETPELVRRAPRRDRATKLLRYIAEVTVNGHPETRARPRPRPDLAPPQPPRLSARAGGEAPRARLERLGPAGFAAWMREQPRPLVTDTTLRDAHQSLLATRIRTKDLVGAAEAYAAGLPDLLSLECWGGATFDVAMRFLTEDPWERLHELRARSPRALLQMLLRGANAVGYANYPDNVVRFFTRQAAEAGVDLFRIFDCFNAVESMRVAIDAVAEAGKLAEGAICYTGDILDPARPKYDLGYYVGVARELERAGCHIIAIKDMAGVLKPAAARRLVGELRQAVGVPIHLHTHDTSGISAATVLAAVEAGVDAFDAAMDSLSGATSQPCLGSLVEALRGGSRDTGLDPQAIRAINFYWERVRAQYAAFESDLRSGASEVYQHELPGGQFTNLREQARALGLGDRWRDIAAAYAEANALLGDIVKVTPSSKVVGDLALMMVGQGLTPAEVLDPAREIAFPNSVVEMLRGELGRPYGGWPAALQAKVLKGEPPIEVRPGACLPSADLEREREALSLRCGRPVSLEELASGLMYPKVFEQFAGLARRFGPTSRLPTPVYFYGLRPGQEIAVDLEPGKTLVIVLTAIGQPDEEGAVRVYFELNGQPRTIRVVDRALEPAKAARRKAVDDEPGHVPAPMPGVVASVAVVAGRQVRAGEVLLAIEAMKMETLVHAPVSGRVGAVHAAVGMAVEARDLLVEIVPEARLVEASAPRA